MRITAQELAALCGVSRGTVDRALHDKPGINPETRAAILRVAAVHGYRPDYLGRSLVRGETRTLGIVVFDLKNRYFAQLLQAIEQTARRLDYAILISLTGKSVPDECAALENLHDRRVDGIILHPVGAGDGYEAFLRRLHVPIVAVGNRLSDGWDYVSFDNRQAAADAVHYLAGRKYRRLIFVAPPLRHAGTVNISAQEDRLAGVRAAAAALAIELSVIQDADYCRRTLELIRPVRPDGAKKGQRTAVLCSSDWYALNLLQAAQAAGLCLPADFGLMGFDRLDILDLISPRLTSVVHPIEAIGSRAVEQIVSRIQAVRTDGAAAGPVLGQTIYLPYRIDAGGSV